MGFDMTGLLDPENLPQLRQPYFTPSRPSPLPRRGEGRVFFLGVALAPLGERVASLFALPLRTALSAAKGLRVSLASRVRGARLAPISAARDCLLPVLGLTLVLASVSSPKVSAQQESQLAPVMTGRYHFLGPEDELAILQEETMLKGFIDVFQGENESDAILSYQIISGSRNANRVEFTTRAIHEKHYHFSGTVGLGRGKKPGDPDYLQLVGVLETCTSNSVTGKSEVARQSVVFKSMGRGESEP
jgi:hypothetical protein